MGFLENTLAFVFVLGVMVLVHELGHFLAARYFDVKVEAFSFGFGPRLFGVKRGETDYKVCLLPLGGFVKMSGENPTEPTDDPRGFLAKPRWQRLIIAFMGPIFNIVLAILLPLGLYMVHYERLAYLTEPARIAYVEEGSPADQAGIQEGDVIVSMDGDPTPTWESVTLKEIAAAQTTVQVTVRRDGERQRFPVHIRTSEASGVGEAGWFEEVPVQLREILPGKPAEAAGLKEDDVLVSIDGEKIDTLNEVSALIQKVGGKQTTVEVLRNGQKRRLTVTPVVREEAGGEETTWWIGVGLMPDYERIETQLGFVDALRQSVDQNSKNATLIFKFLGGLIEQRMSPKSLEGPLGIARLSGEAARRGWPELIGLMAAISLNLGIFNLLPIPILDGGVITLLLFESAIRRDVSLAVKERIVQVGFVFLMLLFAFVMYNDIIKSLAAG